MNKFKSTLLDEYGYIKTIYSLLFHVLGVVLPMFLGILFKLNGLNAFWGLLIFVMVIINLLIFAIMRGMLKLCQSYIQNTILKFFAWLISGEVLAFLFYSLLVIRGESFIFSKFAAWHWDIVPLFMFYFPHYAAVLGGFLVEFYYKDNQVAKYNEDILDDMER